MTLEERLLSMTPFEVAELVEELGCDETLITVEDDGVRISWKLRLDRALDLVEVLEEDDEEPDWQSIERARAWRHSA